MHRESGALTCRCPVRDAWPRATILSRRFSSRDSHWSKFLGNQRFLPRNGLWIQVATMLASWQNVAPSGTAGALIKLRRGSRPSRENQMASQRRRESLRVRVPQGRANRNLEREPERVARIRSAIRTAARAVEVHATFPNPICVNADPRPVSSGTTNESSPAASLSTRVCAAGTSRGATHQ